MIRLIVILVAAAFLLSGSVVSATCFAGLAAAIRAARLDIAGVLALVWFLSLQFGAMVFGFIALYFCVNTAELASTRAANLEAGRWE